MLDSLTTFVEAQAANPWVLLVVLLVAAGDALVPPVPSESVVVALSAVVVASGGPPLVLVGVVAATGAFVGDTLVFLLGRRWGPARLARLARRPLLGRALSAVTGAIDQRGGLVILLARYVPAGRVAVGLTAGASGYPPRRFTAFAAVAATTWSAWSVGVGALAGHWMAGNPVLGAAAGVGVALVLGLVADRLARRVLGRPRPGAHALGDERLHSHPESANNDL